MIRWVRIYCVVGDIYYNEIIATKIRCFFHYILDDFSASDRQICFIEHQSFACLCIIWFGLS